MPQQIRGRGFFTGESLIALANRIYEEALPPLHADQLIPPTGGEMLGAQQVERLVYQHSGRAGWINDYGHDAPRSNVAIIQDRYNIGLFGASYGWNLREQRGAQFSNRPLEARRGIAARRANESFRNSVFFQGSQLKQIFGLARNPYIPRVLLSSADFVKGADPDNTLSALYSLERAVDENSKQAHEATHLLLDQETYNYIAQTRASTLNNDTILQVYERNAMSAKTVVKVREFNDAGPAGGRVAMAVSLGAPDIAEHIVPDPLTILSPQERSLETVVNLVGETAGFITEYPLAHVIGEFS